MKYIYWLMCRFGLHDYFIEAEYNDVQRGEAIEFLKCKHCGAQTKRIIFWAGRGEGL